jgi:hypothetical protein
MTVSPRPTPRIAGELAGKPLDRALLTAFAEQVGGSPSAPSTPARTTRASAP